MLEKYRVEGEEASALLVRDAIAHIAHILSLGDLTNRGTKFHIQKIDMKAGKVTVQATAHIEQFPSA